MCWPEWQQPAECIHRPIQYVAKTTPTGVVSDMAIAHRGVSFCRVWRVSLSVCLSVYGLIKWILFNTFDLSHSTFNSWTWNRIVISSHYILSLLSLTISSDDESEARRKWKATRDWHVKWPPCKLPDNDRVLFTLYSRLTTHLTLFAFNHHPRERTRHLSIHPSNHSAIHPPPLSCPVVGN